MSLNPHADTPEEALRIKIIEDKLVPLQIKREKLEASLFGRDTKAYEKLMTKMTPLTQEWIEATWHRLHTRKEFDN